jgi:hypothetical protein
MHTVPKLRHAVRRLAAQHGLDLDEPGATLRLHLPGHGQLALEAIGGHRVSVTHYVESGGEVVVDPQIVVYTRYNAATAQARQGDVHNAAWVPLEVNERLGGWRLYAEVDTQGNLALYNRAGQADLALYCEQVVAANLARHGWLEYAERIGLPPQPWSEEEIHARDIRLDELAWNEEVNHDRV